MNGWLQLEVLPRETPFAKTVVISIYSRDKIKQASRKSQSVLLHRQILDNSARAATGRIAG